MDEKAQRMVVLVAIFLASIFLALYGLLYSSSYDNREKIFTAIFYQPHDQLNERVFAATMNARFPEGTQPDELFALVKLLHGRCFDEKDGKFSCQLAETGMFCIAGKINIDVQLNSRHTIKSIATKSYVIGC